MATVRQSIDLRVPVHAAYRQLTQFEDYPQFMEEVEAVTQTDSTHLHWTTTMANRPVEWDAEITEQEADRCIAWHNTSGPSNSSRVELQPLGEDSARVTFTLQSEAQQVPGSATGIGEQDMAQRLKMDLARLKDLVERGGARSSPAPGSSYAAGSEGWAGDEDPTAPMTSAARSTAPAQAAPASPAHAAQAPNPRSTAAAVGRAGGTDASAGAQQSGSKGIEHTESLRATDAKDVPGTPLTGAGAGRDAGKRT